VLGLGGWFASVVVILLAFPTVSLDDPLLAVVCVAAPVAVGIYLAWVDRDQRKRLGLLWALAGALGGGWLGLQAETGLLSLVTAIVGAALGGNLGVLALDIRGTRGVEADIKPALETQPSAG
jgi:hypothetical protein